jgi:ABC-type sugar transport system ATPase subunit
MADVTYTSVRKEFGDVVAHQDFSLQTADGEFVVLVGPSGSGKTTALRLLAGLEAISHGEIRVGERVVNRVAPQDRDIAMVFQDYALYPQMTVYDNLASCSSASRARCRAASASASRSAARWCASRRRS